MEHKMGIDILWVLIIGAIVLGIILSALFNWLQKRKDRKDEWL